MVHDISTMNDLEPIYVTQPYLPPLAELIPYLESIWERKFLTNNGPFHEQLEAELCQFLGVDHVTLFANGTLALVAAIQALGIEGEVITTPYSFVATSHALLSNRLTPVFVDIDPQTLNLDPAKIEAAITERTRAILAVHCYGHPCAVDAIQAVADKHNLNVIYDAAHAFGVRDAGGNILRHGDMSVLSFHATKVFNTFEGGAVICRDAKTKQHLDHLKNFGFVDELTVAEFGLNGKMNEFSAALGLLQVRHYDQAHALRRTVDSIYRDLLRGVAGIRCLGRSNETAENFAYFPILLDDEYPVSRDALYARFRAAGIYCRRYFYPLISEHSMYRQLASAAPDGLPVSIDASRRILCLPMHANLTAAQVARVVEVLAKP
jgi:dTDP-4-amino-4,6-dideoxygalactose transaminase